MRAFLSRIFELDSFHDGGSLRVALWYSRSFDNPFAILPPCSHEPFSSILVLCEVEGEVFPVSAHALASLLARVGEIVNSYQVLYSK